MKLSTELTAAAVGLGVVAFVLYRSSGAVKDAVGSVATAINPANPDNIAATAVNKVGQTLSGDSAWSLGGWLASVTGADQNDKIKAMLAGDQTPSQTRYAQPNASSDPGVGWTLGQWGVGGGSYKDLSGNPAINPFQPVIDFGSAAPGADAGGW